MRRHLRCWMVCAIGIALLVGCPGSGPPTARVSGTVKVGGKPMEGAQVTFMAPGAPRAGIGTTDAQGRYQLSTFASNDGAVLGTHTVTITVGVKGAPAMSADKPDAAYGAAMSKAASGAPMIGTEIPGKYANPATSGLTAVVTSGGKNEFDFDLQ
jgi:hypothetical protein